MLYPSFAAYKKPGNPKLQTDFDCAVKSAANMDINSINIQMVWENNTLLEKEGWHPYRLDGSNWTLLNFDNTNSHVILTVLLTTKREYLSLCSYTLYQYHTVDMVSFKNTHRILWQNNGFSLILKYYLLVNNIFCQTIVNKLYFLLLYRIMCMKGKLV